MPKLSATSEPKRRIKVKVRRPGVVSKNKNARSKNSRNYVKPYRGQGR